MKKRFTYCLIMMLFLLRISGQQVFDNEVAKNIILIPESDVNTESWEFAPTFFGEFIAFVNDKKNVLYFDEDKNTPYFDLAFGAKNTLGNLARKASFVDVLSSEYQEGPFCFYNNDRNILFTRSHPVSGKLTIYQASKSGDTWQDNGPMSLLTPNYHQCHPSVSDNGRLLVFAAAENDESDMDIYVAEKINDVFRNPIKLNQAINSDYNDWFPRLVGDSIILFASERPGGVGGLDIYASKFRNGEWGTSEIAPSPINSVSDDMGLIIGNEIAYFSSNRVSGTGKDDLYRIEYKGDLIYNPANALTDLSIIVKDKLSLNVLQGVNIQVIPAIQSIDDVDPEEYQIDLIPQDGSQGEVLLKLTPKGSRPSDVSSTDELGQSFVKVRKKGTYIIKAEKNGYNVYNIVYNFEKLGDNFTIVLEPIGTNTDVIEKPIVDISTSTGAITVFNNIYYDLNSHIIKEGAAIELDALFQVMVDNQNMIVQLGAHTDSRGTRIYNQKLSEKRALSAKTYLTNKGIDPDRMVAIGYGESQLRNQCDDTTYCNEEDHSFNRRTEVKILQN